MTKIHSHILSDHPLCTDDGKASHSLVQSSRHCYWAMGSQCNFLWIAKAEISVHRPMDLVVTKVKITIIYPLNLAFVLAFSSRCQWQTQNVPTSPNNFNRVSEHRFNCCNGIVANPPSISYPSLGSMVERPSLWSPISRSVVFILES